MANSVGRNIDNCEVVLKREYYPEDEPQWNSEEARTVFVSGGFGTNPDTSGNAIFCRGKDGKTFRGEGYMVERFIREVPEDERDLIYVVNVMSVNGVETHDVMAPSTTTATHQVLDSKGWGNLPRRIGVEHDDTLIEVDGVEYAVTVKLKGVSE